MIVVRDDARGVNIAIVHAPQGTRYCQYSDAVVARVDSCCPRCIMQQSGFRDGSDQRVMT